MVGLIAGICDKDGLDETGHRFPEYDVRRIEDHLWAGDGLLGSINEYQEGNDRSQKSVHASNSHLSSFTYWNG